MGKVIPYNEFKVKRRERKYGKDEVRIRRIRAMGFSDDYMVGYDEDVTEHLYGESEEDEDYWLGERSLTEVIK